ncbi:MAG: sigma-E factor negative regulatory protein [Gammaproteobacteria bacterium]|nr:sigma-E factor negative regulatory protein [Gammaproteobacteria bacterium]
MTVNHEELDSQLSAMYDGHLPGAECELLSRRLVREEALRARWARYALIGAVVRSEPVSAARTGFARRVSAAIVADAQPAPRALVPARRVAWQLGLGSALAAGVAVVAVLVLRQQAVPLVDEVVIAPHLTNAPLIAATAPPGQPASAVPAASGREPSSYVTPPAGAGNPLASPVQLASFVVAHSEYSSPLMRRNLLSALVSGDAASVYRPAAAPADGSAEGPLPDGSSAP